MYYCWVIAAFQKHFEIKTDSQLVDLKVGARKRTSCFCGFSRKSIVHSHNECYDVSLARGEEEKTRSTPCLCWLIEPLHDDQFPVNMHTEHRRNEALWIQSWINCKMAQNRRFPLYRHTYILVLQPLIAATSSLLCYLKLEMWVIH